MEVFYGAVESRARPVSLAQAEGRRSTFCHQRHRSSRQAWLNANDKYCMVDSVCCIKVKSTSWTLTARRRDASGLLAAGISHRCNRRCALLPATDALTCLCRRTQRVASNLGLLYLPHERRYGLFLRRMAAGSVGFQMRGVDHQAGTRPVLSRQLAEDPIESPCPVPVHKAVVARLVWP